MDYILEASGLPKVYGQKEPAKDVNLHIREGHIYGLIGRNGAGKTTVMRMISGLSRPTSGSYSLFGKTGLAMQKMLKYVGVLIERPGLDPQGIVEVREMLTRLRDERGITVMVSSHILDELAKVADCYGIIHEGMLIDEFSADELHQRCGKSLILRTDNADETLRLLEGMDIRGTEREPDGTLHLSEGMERAAEIARAVVQSGIGLEELCQRSMTLEEYYLGMTGGEHHG